MNVALQAANPIRMGQPTASVLIDGIELHDPPKVGWTQHRFYIEFYVNGRSQTTSSAGYKMQWKDQLRLYGGFYCVEAYDHSVIELAVFARRLTHENAHIGTFRGQLGMLLSQPGVIRRDLSPALSNSHHDKSSTPAISFSIRRVDQTPEPQEGTQTAASTGLLRGAQIGLLAAACPTPNDLQPILQPILSGLEAFGPVVEKIHLVLSVVEQFSEIHPYAKMAAVIMSTAIKACAAHWLIMKSIKNLSHAMSEAYGFVAETNRLEAIESHREIIGVLARQTVECTYFIQELHRKAGSQKVISAVTFPNIEAKIQRYVTKFQDLRAALQYRAVIETELLVLRLCDEVQGLHDHLNLDNMPYATGAQYRNLERCRNGLEPHHTKVVDDIIHWINGETTERICFLSGPRDSGKTTIAWEAKRHRSPPRMANEPDGPPPVDTLGVELPCPADPPGRDPLRRSSENIEAVEPQAASSEETSCHITTTCRTQVHRGDGTTQTTEVVTVVRGKSLQMYPIESLHAASDHALQRTASLFGPTVAADDYDATNGPPCQGPPARSALLVSRNAFYE
ncbi:hypothetical protein HYDPIDRAFT_169297 [Hydnomerulius pinastri MD-312]|uniref:Uncharacterized protein n=1 Tax=Hydnomerulius pinastri MD-312 TaxID=994086 RepID=A0A0C9W5W6_9AGAM|nr:hypothetical protein HYDPIDRAFT_169297 [Hydnomerulius pinastri MD-312]